MFAKADGQTRETNSQTVGLNFQHGMSQVVFSGKLASDKIEATVHGIEIHNLHNTGKVGYMGTNAELQAQTTGEAGTTFAAGLVDNPVVNSSSQATVLSAADGALFMLPQTVAKWTTTAKNPVPTSEADANHNSYLKVTCTVKDKASGVVLVNNGSIYIPLEVNWQQGKKYSYTLVFGQGEQGFKPDGSHDDNLLQIKYSVSAENWNAAGNEDLGMGGGFEKPEPKPLIYQTGTNVKLINSAEYCKSIIADGKELITGKESGELVVPELNDEKVYITFKEDVTDFSGAFNSCTSLESIPEQLFANNTEVTNFRSTFSNCTSLTSIPENLFQNCSPDEIFEETFCDCTSLQSIPEGLFANCPKAAGFSFTFSGCSALKSIPENLFANNTKVTDFSGTFVDCTSLKSIPENLFANNTKVTNFYVTFSGCKALTGESPYTMIDGQKVHIYERQNYPEHFTTPTDFNYTFMSCTGLTDYAQIPSDWK